MTGMSGDQHIPVESGLCTCVGKYRRLLQHWAGYKHKIFVAITFCRFSILNILQEDIFVRGDF